MPAGVLPSLNPEQLQAVTAPPGPLLVLAGAGTGKTRVITARVAWLLEQGARPGEVLAITFTNKAAREMRERLRAAIGERAAKVVLGTFHAFCLRLLRDFPGEAGLAPDFAIADAGDQLNILRGVLRELRVGHRELRPEVLLARISLLRNRLQEPDEDDELLALAYRRYTEELRRQRLVDFDGLLLAALALLRDRPEVRRRLRRRHRHILVDEYQDTNLPQYELLRLLAGRRPSLTVVGDDDQGIYGWRGADVGRILAFPQDFPGTRVVRLETNYRSTAPILDLANRLIRNNPVRHEKSLRAAAGAGPEPEFLELRDEEDEAEFLIRRIQHEVREGRARWGDFAILFRTGNQPRPFEAELRRRNIPYRLVGGQSFFDRKEVRDVLAFLRVAANPADEVSLLRVANVPPRGLGRTSVERLLAFAHGAGLPAGDALGAARNVPGVTAAARRGATALAEALERLRRRARRNLVQAIREFLEEIRYRDEVERCYDDPLTRETRWNGTLEVLDMAENHVRRVRRPDLATFLQELALTAGEAGERREGGSDDAVTLMTLHAAKGLEFPRVLLPGIEEGILPHARTLAEDGVAEERRLLYVGITRARRHLTLSCVAERSRQGRRTRAFPSRFWFELLGEPPGEDWRAWEAGAGEVRPQAVRRATGGRRPGGRGRGGSARGRRGAGARGGARGGR